MLARHDPQLELAASRKTASVMGLPTTAYRDSLPSKAYMSCTVFGAILFIAAGTAASRFLHPDVMILPDVPIHFLELAGSYAGNGAAVGSLRQSCVVWSGLFAANGAGPASPLCRGSALLPSLSHPPRFLPRDILCSTRLLASGWRQRDGQGVRAAVLWAATAAPARDRAHPPCGGGVGVKWPDRGVRVRRQAKGGSSCPGVHRARHQVASPCPPHPSCFAHLRYRFYPPHVH